MDFGVPGRERTWRGDSEPSKKEPRGEFSELLRIVRAFGDSTVTTSRWRSSCVMRSGMSGTNLIQKHSTMHLNFTNLIDQVIDPALSFDFLHHDRDVNVRPRNILGTVRTTSIIVTGMLLAHCASAGERPLCVNITRPCKQEKYPKPDRRTAKNG